MKTAKEVKLKSKAPKIKRRFRKDDLELTLLAIPTFVWYILFSYLPMFGIILAFKNMTYESPNFIVNLVTSPWAGLENFKFIFSSGKAWQITRNTLAYNIIFIILGTVIPVALAILIKQLRSKKLSKIFQSMVLLPYFISWVAVTYFVSAFIDVRLGFVNQTLGLTTNWYQEQQIWPGLLIFLNVWKTTGYNMVIYLATITSMDESVFEASRIDGASKWQQLRLITLPLLKPIIIMMFILALGRIFYADFGLFYNVPRQSPSLLNVTDTYDIFVYRALNQSTRIGPSSAAAFIQSVAGCLTILGANFVVRKIDRENALI